MPLHAVERWGRGLRLLPRQRQEPLPRLRRGRHSRACDRQGHLQEVCSLNRKFAVQPICEFSCGGVVYWKCGQVCLLCSG